MKPEVSSSNDEPLPFNKVTIDQVFDLLNKRRHNEATKHPVDCLSIPNFIIIDCRSPEEYQGGHIEGAVNISTPE